MAKIELSWSTEIDIYAKLFETLKFLLNEMKSAFLHEKNYSKNIESKIFKMLLIGSCKLSFITYMTTSQNV